MQGLKCLNFLFYPDSAAALVPFVAGSHRLLPALLSTKPLPAGSVVCLVHPPADLFFYWQKGHVSVLLETVPASIWWMDWVTAGMVFLSDSGAGTGQLIVTLGEDLIGATAFFQELFLLGWKGDNLVRGLCRL